MFSVRGHTVLYTSSIIPSNEVVWPESQMSAHRVDKGQGFSLPIRSWFYFIFFRAVRQGTQEAAVLYEIIEEGDVLK